MSRRRLLSDLPDDEPTPQATSRSVRSRRATPSQRRQSDYLNDAEADQALADLEAGFDQRDASPATQRATQEASNDADGDGNDDNNGDGVTSDGNDEDDAAAEEYEVVQEIDAAIANRPRPAATGSAPAASRHNWTKLEDAYLLLGVAEVGVGNWPRVLHTIHARWHQLTWAKGPAPLRRRYTLLRSERSWLEKPPATTFRLPRGVKDGSAEAIRLEREFSKVVEKERRLWERCVRVIARIDNRNKSLGSNKSDALVSEQAALRRAKEKEAVRQAAKDARNEHFQSVVDQDIEIRDNIATTMQARVQSSERLSRAFEMIAIATLTSNLGAAAAPLISQLFGDNAPRLPTAAAPASVAAPAPAPAPGALALGAPAPGAAPGVPAPAPGDAQAPARQ